MRKGTHISALTKSPVCCKFPSYLLADTKPEGEAIVNGKREDLHTVMNLTDKGEVHFTQHEPDDCPVHGNGQAKGKSFTGSTEAFRLGWDQWQAQSRKANFN